MESRENLILYAQWEPVIYKISYDYKGGLKNNNPTKYSCETQDILLKGTTKKNNDFEGWYSDSKYRNKITQIDNGSIGNKKLYAKWKKKLKK